MSDSTEITKHEPKKPFRPGAQPVGLAAKKAAAQRAAIENAKNSGIDTTPLFTDPNKMPDRIGLVFDDSGSMGCGNAIHDAHTGVEEFLRSSNPKTTAVAIYPMNAAPIALSSALPAVAIMVKSIGATGGTPALDTLDKMDKAENLTRAIMFSDGSFTMWQWDVLRDRLREKHLPVDTIFIGDISDKSAIANLSKIAEETGGIFLHFQPGKTLFSKAFKYLSPGLRLRLMDKSFREAVERGEV